MRLSSPIPTCRARSRSRVALRIAIPVALLLAVAGCEKPMNISDEELIKRITECAQDDNLTPGMAVACGNYQKECKRRGDRTGNYIC